MMLETLVMKTDGGWYYLNNPCPTIPSLITLIYSFSSSRTRRLDERTLIDNLTLYTVTVFD